MTRIFKIPDFKPPQAAWPVTFDVSSFVGTGKLTNVQYQASNAANTDVTSTVLNGTLSSFTATKITAFIQGGVDGEKYKMMITFTTAVSTVEQIILVWAVKNLV